MYNPNWNRWLRASVNKHFAAQLSAYNVFIEGMKRTRNDKDDFCEIRMDGPYFREVSKDYFEVYIEVNILVQTAITRSKNLYQHEDILGAASAAFTTIPVFKLGSNDGDDESQIGCLNLRSQPQDPVKVSDFGQIKAETELRQACVEGHYTIQLS